MLSVLALLAEGEAGRPGEPQWFQPLLLWVPLMLVFYFLLILPMRKERRQRMQMAASLKKGDRVIIQNAIVGTVAADPKADEKGGETEVLVRIDDNANVRLRVLLSAVTRVIKEDSKDGA
jgi:preprotein translocase subunit YajC